VKAVTPEYITSAPVNWGHLLDGILTDYESFPAKGVAHGLQKEAIQNGWGARKSKSGKGWSFEFRLLTTGGPRLLTMADGGTTGLTGDKNFDRAALKHGEPIPDDQRLARFESVYESGGGEGPGLFGRGKLIFNVASKQHLIYYDSRTETGEYRFGERQIQDREYRQYREVLEGKNAEDKLAEVTSGRVKPLTKTGTRIIIVDPIDEVVEAVENGDFLNAVEETWWELILRYDATVSVEVEPSPSNAAAVPSDFGGLPQKSRDGWKVYYRENIPIDDGSPYRIKHLHLIVSPPEKLPRADLLGVVLHRRGMAIGTIRLSGVPSDLQQRLFGYVDLEPKLEDALVEARQENNTHYGFAYTTRVPYRQIRQTVQANFEDFLGRLGYKKPGTSPEEQVKRLAEDAQRELNTVLNALGVPGFGGGTDAAQLTLSVENLAFPSGTNEVHRGDLVSGFNFHLGNLGRKDQKLRWSVRTAERDTGLIETLFGPEDIDVKAGSYALTPSLEINLDGRYPAPGRVACTCEVVDVDGKLKIRRTFHLYLEITRPKPKELASIQLMMAEWPHHDSSRVNYGESIKNLLYQVENRTSLPMKVRLRLRTLWAKESNTPIKEIDSRDVEVGPFQVIPIKVPAVEVTEADYQEVGRDKVNLRMHATALEDTPDWDKSEKLAEQNTAFWIEMDPDYGFFDAIEYNKEGREAPRSRAVASDAGKRWTLSINITHPAYENTADDEDRRGDYIFEEMARQTVYVLIAMGKGDVLARQADLDKDEDVFEMTPEDLFKRVGFPITDHILAAYYGR